MFEKIRLSVGGIAHPGQGFRQDVNGGNPIRETIGPDKSEREIERTRERERERVVERESQY